MTRTKDAFRPASIATAIGRQLLGRNGIVLQPTLRALAHEHIGTRKSTEDLHVITGLALLDSLYQPVHIERVHEHLTLADIDRLDVRVDVDVNVSNIHRSHGEILHAMSTELATFDTRSRAEHGSSETPEAPIGLWLPLYLIPRTRAQPTQVTADGDTEVHRLPIEVVRRFTGRAVNYCIRTYLQEHFKNNREAFETFRNSCDEFLQVTDEHSTVTLPQLLGAQEDDDEALYAMYANLVGLSAQIYVDRGQLPADSEPTDAEIASPCGEIITTLAIPADLLHMTWLAAEHSFIVVHVPQNRPGVTFTFDLPPHNPHPMPPEESWIERQRQQLATFRSGVVVRYVTQAPALADSLHVTLSTHKDLQVFPFLLLVHRTGIGTTLQRRLEARQRQLAECPDANVAARAEADERRLRELWFHLGEYALALRDQLIELRRLAWRNASPRKRDALSSGSDEELAGIFAPRYAEFIDVADPTIARGIDDHVTTDNDPRDEVAHAHWVEGRSYLSDIKVDRAYEATVVAHIFPRHHRRFAREVRMAIILALVTLVVGAAAFLIAQTSFGSLPNRSDAVATLMLLAPAGILVKVVTNSEDDIASHLQRVPRLIGMGILGGIVVLATVIVAVNDQESPRSTFLVASTFGFVVILCLGGIWLTRVLIQEAPHLTWERAIDDVAPEWFTNRGTNHFTPSRSDLINLVINTLRVPRYLLWFGFSELIDLPGDASDSIEIATSDYLHSEDILTADQGVSAGRTAREYLYFLYRALRHRHTLLREATAQHYATAQTSEPHLSPSATRGSATK